MTRFARAKGSKASNERVAEEATSWQEMKHQLIQNKKDAEFEEKKKLADQQRNANYQKFLKEKQEEAASTTEWAPFPNTGISETSKVIKKPKQKIAIKPKEEVKKKEMPKEKSVKVNIDELPEKEKQLVLKKIEKKKRQVEKRKMMQKLNKLEKRKNAEKEKSSQEKQPVEKPINAANTPQKKPNKIQDKKLERKRTTERSREFHTEKVIINGKEFELEYFDGFPVKKEDAEALKQLKEDLIKKALPLSEIKQTMKLERRKAEKALAREKKKVCFNCRKPGHTLAECPDTSTKQELIDTSGTGICFKCGSTEHTSFACRVVRDQSFKFATCFICKEQGHISRQCPDNSRGLYPKGGSCRVCGDVTHLKKDCPQFQQQQEKEQDKYKVQVLNDRNPEDLNNIHRSFHEKTNGSSKPSIIKF